MKCLPYVFLLVSFCAVSSVFQLVIAYAKTAETEEFCAEGVDYTQNEVDLDAIHEMKKIDKVSKPKKFPSKSYESNEVAERQRLINYILSEGYDRRNYPTNMTIKLGLALLSIDIDERKNTLETDVWLKMIWSDKRLAWDKSDFNVDVLRMNPGEIWTPDTTLYNSATPFEMMKCSDTNTLIYPDGEVLWVPPCHLSAHCNLTVNTDPYGPQKCYLKFGSWTFDQLSMDLQIYDNDTKADDSDLFDTTQWKLISNDFTRDVKFYDCCPEPYVSLTYNLTVQRKSTLSRTVSRDS